MARSPSAWTSGKPWPPGERRAHQRLAVEALDEGLDGEPLMDAEFPGGQGFPDVHAVADLATLRVALAAGHRLDARRSARAGRRQRRSAAAACSHARSPRSSRGLTRRRRVRAGVLPRARAAGRRRHALLARHGHGVHDGRARRSRRRAAPDPRALDGSRSASRRQTASSRPASSRSTSHTEALAAADRAFLLEEIVKDVAASHGLLATFMAKPFTEHEGRATTSTSRSGGATTTRSRTTAAALERARVGVRRRVLAHAAGLTALASPTVNSYKRLAATEASSPPARRSGATTGSATCASRPSAAARRGSRCGPRTRRPTPTC